MKKIALALICGLSLVATGCSKKTADASASEASAAAETSAATADISDEDLAQNLADGIAASQAGEKFASSLNIRYVSHQLILSHYRLSMEIMEEAQETDAALQKTQAQYAADLQKRANEIQTKLQSNGYISQDSYDKDVKDLNDKQAAYEKQYAKKAEEAAAAMAKRQQQLADSINNYIIAANKKWGYDAILYQDAGLYFNPALDITQEVVDGLNARYKK